MEEGGEEASRDAGFARSKGLMGAAGSARGEEVRVASNPQTQAEIGNSRVSPGQVFRLVQTFSQYKKQLIDVIGFGGILMMPNLTKINLKFSLWLLSRVDVNAQAIVVDEDRMIRFFDEDVEKIFGIPCGLRKIGGVESQVTQESVQFMRASLGLTDRDAHSLKKVEAFLNKDVSESSSRMEQECFQIAFVIFVMGHLLSPSAKHDYVTIDYWGALKSADHIINYNWCSCVVKSVIDAARKIQSGCHGKGPIAIPGCHLFLQVFFLDNMNVGSYNLPHNVLPRIKVFDADMIKLMFQRSIRSTGDDEMHAVGLPRVAESVCYKRRKVEPSMSRGEPVSQNWRCPRNGEGSSSGPTRPDAGGNSSPAGGICGMPSNTTADMDDRSKLDIAKFLTPAGFFDYFKTKYPTLISCSVMDVLKRYNAMCVKHHVEYQRAMIKENIHLTEQLIGVLGHECIQQAGKSRGSLHGRSSVGEPKNSLTPSKSATGDSNGPSLQIVIREGQGESSVSNSSKHISRGQSIEQATKRASDISMSGDGHRSKRAATEGCCSVSSGRARVMTLRDDGPSFDLGIDADIEPVLEGKAMDENVVVDIYRTPDAKTGTQSQLSPRTANKAFSELIIGEIINMQNEKNMAGDGKILFGDATATPVPRRKLVTGDFAPNPFYNGHVHPRPVPEILLSLYIWITGQHVNELERPWITHQYPRHIELTGHDIKEQLFGARKIDPDMFSLLMRRFGQLDSKMNTGKAEHRWRHFLEADFAAFSLAGNDVTGVLSIQNQFIGDAVTYNLARTEMFVVPAWLIDGWVCYVWDMKKKMIHVLDPMNVMALPSERRSTHEDVTSVLHSSLAKCLASYFDDWLLSETPWPRFYPSVGLKNLRQEQSGIAAAYLARNYDGKCVEPKLNQDIYTQAPRRLLYDLLQLEGNMSNLPNDVVNAMTCYS